MYEHKKKNMSQEYITIEINTIIQKLQFHKFKAPKTRVQVLFPGIDALSLLHKWDY